MKRPLVLPWHRCGPVPKPPNSVALLAFSVVTLAYLLTLAPSLSSTSVDWRESDVLMVGRNLCRGECSLWLPRINAAGDGEGITGMELPILNRMGALFSCGDDGQVVASRLWTLLFALVGIGSLALVAWRHLSWDGAAVALVGFAFSPVVLYYGRAVQPDIPSAALALLSVLLVDIALSRETTRWGLWFASAAAMAIGALIKLPALVYGLPLVALTWQRRGRRALGDVRYWLFLPLALVPAWVWYSHARALQAQYGIHYFNLGSSWDALLADWTSARFYQRLARQLFDVYASPLISAIAVGSLLLKWRQVPNLISSMALAALVFLFLGGWVAAWHNCYGAMVVPPLSLAAGWGAQQMASRLSHRGLRGALLAVLSTAAAGYGLHRTHRWLTRPAEAPLFTAAKQRLDEWLGGRKDLLVVISDGDPKALWYLDRKGFVLSEKEGEWLRSAQPPPPRSVLVDLTRVQRTAGRSQALRATLEGLGYRAVLENGATQLWLKDDLPVTREP